MSILDELRDCEALRELAVELDGRPIPRVRMTEREFVAWCPEEVRAEWVDGEVVMMSPANAEHVDVTVWLTRVEGVEELLVEAGVVVEVAAAEGGSDFERVGGAVMVAQATILALLMLLGCGCAIGPKMSRTDGVVRVGTVNDLDAIEELAEMKRAQYAAYQPRMWNPAVEAKEKHAAYLKDLISAGKVIALMHECGGNVDGFLIGDVRPAPPVYDAGGLTCVVDDFMVEREDWEGAGVALLNEALRIAKTRGASQLIVVCGHRDEAKRAMLKRRGLSIASEWYTRGIE